jgi:hypothetical protein
MQNEIGQNDTPWLDRSRVAMLGFDRTETVLYESGVRWNGIGVRRYENEGVHVTKKAYVLFSAEVFLGPVASPRR